MHFNIRSISKNKHILEDLLIELDNFPEILAISETKLNNQNVNYASIQNYKLAFTYSSSNAGGVALYILNKLNYSRRQDLEFQSTDSESVFIEIDITTHKKLVVAVIYRHPNKPYHEFQDHIMQKLNKLNHENKDYLICGDFNINLLKHETKRSIDNYINTLYSEGCINIIDKPTRITETTATLLDHMYTNLSNNSVNSGILTFDISDHLPTFCTLSKKPVYTHKKILLRDIKKFNKDCFLDNINSLALKTDALISCNENYSIENVMNQFINEFSARIDQGCLI